ncbi:MAG: hypothetical protein M1277_01155 [Patescibacteria group bacterium]|nr:hypothetical protein [Patescibacteria group bacterium]
MPDIFVAPTQNPAAKINTLPQKPTVPQANTPFLPNSRNTSASEIPDTDFHIRSHIHLFASLCKNPLGVTFQNQGLNERVLLFVRKDFVTNFPWIAIASILFFVPSLFPFFGKTMNIQLTSLPLKFFLYFIFSYYLFLLIYVFVNFIDWYFNIALITNVRVIELSFSGIVYKDVSATKIDLLQDVSFSQIGVLRTVFDYGDVLVQTAGTLENFTFKAVPEPENIVNFVEDLIGKEENV